MQGVGGQEYGKSMTRQTWEEIKELNFGLKLSLTPKQMSLNKPETGCTQMFVAALLTIGKK